jgi:hypothetical protein
MAVSNPTLSYPKPRRTCIKIIPIARTDSSTAKCVLPKDAIISTVTCYQNVNASTAAASWTVGWAADTDGILNAFSAATTAVGQVHPGTAIGSGVFARLTSDVTVISTFGVGSSTAGGTGYVIIEYFVPGPGEAVDD